MPSFYVGDLPAGSIFVPAIRDGEEVDLALYTSASVYAYDPQLVETVWGGHFTATLVPADDDEQTEGGVEIGMTGGIPLFTQPGLWSLGVFLLDGESDGGYGSGTYGGGVYGGRPSRGLPTLRLDPFPIVVEAVSGWHTMSSARALWIGAPVDDVDLYELLTVARDQVLDFAPARFSEPGAEVPVRFKRAQLMQARNIWNASKKDEQDQMGGEGFTVTVWPMDWSVKNLIRPKRGLPEVR